MRRMRRVKAGAVVVALVAGAAVTAYLAHPADAGTRVANGHDAGRAAAAVAALQKGHGYRHGVQPTKGGASAPAPKNAAGQAPQLVTTGLQYFGGTDGVGVVTSNPKVYIVYWGSQWGTPSINESGDTTFSGDTVGMAPYQQQLFRGIGTHTEPWSHVPTQYCQGVATGATSCPPGAQHVAYPNDNVQGGVLAGVWYDAAAPVATSATAQQIAQEAIAAASHFGNTTAAANQNAQYIITFPTGTTPDGWSPDGSDPAGAFCAWHDYNGDPDVGPVSSPYGDIAFTNMPYLPDAHAGCGEDFVNGPDSAGALDGVSIVGGHEFTETVTDPFPYYAPSNTTPLPDSGGWLAPIYDASNNFQLVGAMENADLCAWIPPHVPGGAADIALVRGRFAMQATWSNADQGCVTPMQFNRTGQGNDVPDAKPVVVFDPNNGNVEVFDVAYGGDPVEKYWSKASGIWSGWQFLRGTGGGALSGGLAGTVSVLYDPNNRNIEVFGTSGGQLVERYWNAGNGQWSGWQNLGGALSSSPVAFYNPNNRNIEIYGNSGGQVTEKYWNAGNGQWSGWQNLGGTTIRADLVPSVFYNPGNRNVEIYINSAEHLSEKYWNAGNGQWSGWNDLGGSLLGAPSVLYNPNNRNVEIYVASPNGSPGRLSEKYWNAGNGEWSGRLFKNSIQICLYNDGRYNAL